MVVEIIILKSLFEKVVVMMLLRIFVVVVMVVSLLIVYHHSYCESYPFGIDPQDVFGDYKAKNNIHDLGIAGDNYGPIDVLHYSIETDVSQRYRLEGRTTILIESLADDLSRFRVDFEGLEVASVRLDGGVVDYAYDGRSITVEPGFPILRGTEFELEVSYNGMPRKGFYFSGTSIHTHCEPKEWTDRSWARYWFPCKAVPWDKATSETITKVPSGMIVASNGLLVDVVENRRDLTTTYHWREEYPISTYLISLAISDYYTFSDHWGDVELTYFVYPYLAGAAPSDFSDVPDMMSFYSERICPYPFEKYGMACAEIPGGMENQTITTINPYLVTGHKTFNWLYAHELAHQWWGDLVTLSDWREIWLNEGFATYFDALYTEHSSGKISFISKLKSFRDEYLNNLFQEDFPIYAPDYMWGATVYEKGALVLHMLRNIVGDENFWTIIQSYAKEFAYSNATIADFIKICEETYGEDLEWFFDEWIYQKGYPEYNLSWFSKRVNDNTYVVEVVFQQIQRRLNDYHLFKMPFKFEFVKPDKPVEGGELIPHSYFIDKMIDDEIEKFSFLLDFEPIGFNPDAGRFSLRKMYYLMDYVPPRFGTVGFAFEKIENILLVNGSSGNDEREEVTFVGRPFRLEILQPSYLDHDIEYLIYAEFDDCKDVGDFVYLPAGIGTFCFSIPPTSGNPVVIANNIGFEELLGKPIFPTEPGQSTVIDARGGFGEPVTVTFQGLILDPMAESGVSITNAVVVKVLAVN